MKPCPHCGKPCQTSGDYIAPTCGASECQEAEFNANRERARRRKRTK